MKQLGITRAQEELLEIGDEATRLDIRVVPLPLFGYEPVNFEITSEELWGINWLCFTSSRGVEYFFHALKEGHHAIAPETQFAVIGKKTARALEARGFHPDLQPSVAEGEKLAAELLERLDSDETIVYITAEEVRYDPAPVFEKAGQNYRRLVVYRAEPLKLDKNLDKKIANEFTSEDSILFTSPNSALRFAELFGPPQAQVLAIGNVTAAAITRLGWENSQTLPEPDVRLALELCLHHPVNQT